MQWTLAERMTVFHLFVTYGFDPYETNWMPIFTGVTGSSRTWTNVSEDWRFRDNDNRSKMYARQIMIPSSRYTIVQRNTYNQSQADIATVAARLNITLSARPAATNLVPVASASNGNAVAGGSTMVYQQKTTAPVVKKRKAAAAAPKKQAKDRASTAIPAPSSLPPSKKHANEPQKANTTTRQRELKAVVHEPTEDQDAALQGSDDDSAESCVVVASSKQAAAEQSEADDEAIAEDSDAMQVDHADSETKNRTVDQFTIVPLQQPLPSQAPGSQALSIAPTPTAISTSGRQGYNQWRRVNLDRILLEKPVNRFPGPPFDPTLKKHKRPRVPQPPTAHERMVGYFEHMFGAHRTQIDQAIKSEPASDEPGDQIHRITSRLNNLGLLSSFRRFEVFSDPASPFPNFRLATAAHSRGLEMLHTNNVHFTGPGGNVVAVYSQRGNQTLTASNARFIDRDDPIFQRGGRVFTIEVHQPEMDILGNERAFNTAVVTLDVMLCDKSACQTCSPQAVLDDSPSSGLPRVHRRHLTPDNKFVQVDPHLYGTMNADKGGEFPAEAPTYRAQVEFWDGGKQDAVICSIGSCSVCSEMHTLEFNKKYGQYSSMDHFRKTLAYEAGAKRMQKTQDTADRKAATEQRKEEEQRERDEEQQTDEQPQSDEDSEADEDIAEGHGTEPDAPRPRTRAERAAARQG